MGQVAGFSLHAGVAAKAHQRQKLERLCRYISRPAVSEQRLSLAPNGNVRYQLKTPYRDGTTHVIFEPLDFIARLAALVPKPRGNLTRPYGIFAPNSRDCTSVTPAKRASAYAAILPLKGLGVSLSANIAQSDEASGRRMLFADTGPPPFTGGE